MENREYLKHIISEAISDINSEQEVLNKIKSGEEVYHRPMDSRNGDPLAIIKSLLKNGFSREYTGKNGGNMYGEGVYNVYTLRSSNEKARGYGHYIMKSYVIDGYKDFLIFNRDIAKRYYGEDWWIGKQIERLMPRNIANKVLDRYRDKLYMNDFNTLYRRTSDLAYSIVCYLSSAIYRTKIRGIIYDGGHDGSCAFVRDFSAVVPYAYSVDNGRTWTDAVNINLANKLLNTIDPEFELRHRVNDMGVKLVKGVSNNSVNGHNIVSKVIRGKTKYNLYSVKSGGVISPIWFDAVTDFSDDMYSNVSINGQEYGIAYDEDTGTYILCSEYGEEICDLNDIESNI